MVLKVEEGKFYRTRRGIKVGPVLRRDGGAADDTDGPFKIAGLWNYTEDGLVGTLSKGDEPDDLVSEWSDEPPSPVRTVTRKEIVPGHFGLIEIEHGPNRVTAEGVSLWLPRNHRYSPAELRATASTLIEIADALGSETPA